MTLGDQIRNSRTARDDEAVGRAQGYTDDVKAWLQGHLENYSDNIRDQIMQLLSTINGQLTALNTAKASKNYVDNKDAALAARIDSLLANNPSLLP